MLEFVEASERFKVGKVKDGDEKVGKADLPVRVKDVQE